MNYFAFSAIVNFTTSSLILIFVGKSADKKNITTVTFLLFAAAVSFWSMNYFLWQISLDEKRALLFSKLFMFGAIWIPCFFFHFITTLLTSSRKLKKLTIFNYFASCMCSILVFNSIFIRSVEPNVYFSHWPVPGPAFHVFLAYFVAAACFAHFILWREIVRIGDQRKKLQLKYVFFGTLVGFIGGSTNYFLWYNIPIPPYGNILVSVYVATVAYSIVRHQLMEIEVIFKRATVFAGLFGFVYGIFSIFTFAGQELFKSVFQGNSWLSSIPTVIVITIALRPLENFLTNATDRFLFQKKYDYRELLRTFTNEVLTILDLQKLTEQTITDLTKIIKLESATILLLDSDTKSYRIAACVGLKDKLIVFEHGDTLITYLKQSHQPLIKDKEAEAMEGHSTLREDFKRLNAQICLPIAHHDELLGVLCLGMKKSGEEFTPEDIDILMTLARTEGIAIANAQLFDQLSKTQAEAAQREKMAVIGTLAAGINHEICNPLGIVRGQCEMFLLNLRDGIYSEKSKDDLVKISTEIMNKVIRETDRATAITKRLSGFAKPAKKMDSEEVSIEKETDEVLGLVGHDLKLSNIQFIKDFETGFPTILADRRQIQEVLFNIIRNAAQAMDKNDGQITLSGASANGMAIIKIADNGSGIPKDKIGQIFNPFFTTKEPGKGTGLGLFIVRQVIERNHGTIAVDSEDGVGTTFTLTFPTTVTAKAIAA